MQIPITIEGKKRLEEELKRLKTVDRPTVIQAIATARAHGDLSENAEYDAAREEQGFIEGRIAELEDKLSRMHVIDPKEIKTDKIVFGATVTIQDTESEQTKVYRILGADETDVKNGHISIESPIARQLLNKRVGDVVLIRVPKGDMEYEVLEIKYE